MTAKAYAKAAEAPKERIDGLPTDRAVAVYYRQSSEGQIGNESTAQQQEDLPDLLVEMGWTRENIIHIYDDQAVSGTLDIDKRVGMSRLMDMISNREIGAVAMVSENRAFRDQYQVNAAMFARNCAENHVIVIVPNGETYVFHDPVHGNFYHELFLRACKEGHNYIQQHIKGKMLAAKKRRALRGEWTGGSIPLGYMVDLATRRFVIYEPIAAVIREYFRLFVFVYLGNLAATARHIREYGPYLPDLDGHASQADLPKNADGSPKYRLKKPFTMPLRNGRYYPVSGGLHCMLTNAVFIGYWVTSSWEYYTTKSGKRAKRLSKTTIKTDVTTGKPEIAHEPIIDQDTFWAAFNYLSPHRLDGEPNPDYKPARTTRQKYPNDPYRVGVPRPFLEGMLFSPNTRGDLQSVGITWCRKTQKYEYAALSWGESWGDESRRLWLKTADKIDAVVHEMIHMRIFRNHEDHSNIASNLGDHWNSQDVNFDSGRKKYQDLIRLAEKDLTDAKTRWENSTLPELVKEAEAAYIKVKSNIASYRDSLSKIDTLEADHSRQAELRKWLFEMTADYHGLSLEDKRLVLQLIVERVEAYKQGVDFEIKVIFHGGKTESRTIGLGNADWTSKECNTLIDLAEHGATPLQMAGFMPDRNLRSIIAKYWRLTGKGMSAKDCLIRKDETFYDYVARQPMGYDMYWLEARKSRETLLDFLALTPEEVSQKFDEEASAIFATRFPNFVARQPERGIIEDQNEVVISNGSLCTTF